eukprot:TRINITY_DN38980_c0_g1_i1.p1 TRINITY_DN38980_c0_g1~~TRINITY_DN38980_c0_g1_i1.p1  ORF type:complete len:279 (+),score=35.83 TRINITY_DN38980_c0_g1_i1:121-957(+)
MALRRGVLVPTFNSLAYRTRRIEVILSTLQAQVDYIEKCRANASVQTICRQEAIVLEIPLSVESPTPDLIGNSGPRMCLSSVGTWLLAPRQRAVHSIANRPPLRPGDAGTKFDKWIWRPSAGTWLRLNHSQAPSPRVDSDVVIVPHAAAEGKPAWLDAFPRHLQNTAWKYFQLKAEIERRKPVVDDLIFSAREKKINTLLMKARHYEDLLNTSEAELATFMSELWPDPADCGGNLAKAQQGSACASSSTSTLISSLKLNTNPGFGKGPQKTRKKKKNR